VVKNGHCVYPSAISGRLWIKSRRRSVEGDFHSADQQNASAIERNHWWLAILGIEDGILSRLQTAVIDTSKQGRFAKLDLRVPPDRLNFFDRA
jgi:hypothetical protein